jgi:predicted mannosyl-3-phosphoglycerate phosphatase (HAD superfamily)
MHRNTTPYPQSWDRTMLVFTCVDGALRDATSGPCTSARSAVHALNTKGIPVVLTSHHTADELLILQQDLGLREPFIAECGRQLHIPRGYFVHSASLSGPAADWEMIEFSPPSVTRAVEVLMWLYRISGESPMLIGVGTSWTDHLLLAHVDIPILVRNTSFDQMPLRRRFPSACLTTATGLRGWQEAMFGQAMAEGDEPLENPDDQGLEPSLHDR